MPALLRAQPVREVTADEPVQQAPSHRDVLPPLAAQRDVTINTVGCPVKQRYGKLGAHSREQAIACELDGRAPRSGRPPLPVDVVRFPPAAGGPVPRRQAVHRSPVAGNIAIVVYRPPAGQEPARRTDGSAD